MQATPRSNSMLGIFVSEDVDLNISTAIPPLLLIQKDQLSVNGERMYTMYW